MSVKEDVILSATREGTAGFTGTLYDSNDAAVAIVVNGVITELL